MKKVLILTTSTGQGHNQAANSLIDTYTKAGYECVKCDFLYDTDKLVNKVVTWTYEMSASKIPHIYGFFYNLTNVKFTNDFSSLAFFNVRRNLLKIITRENPDLIVGTHPFVVNIICKLKKNGLNIPFISIVTDFCAHSTYINPLVDTYITASEDTKKSLTKHAIKPEIIHPIGIPIKESFYHKDSNIPEIKDDNYFNLLLMSGSMGLKNISYVVDELLKNSHKLRITVVCGNNESLKNSLLKKCQKSYTDKKLHIVGFSNDIASFMEYSDILISKPGGLTVTEAIVKNLPLIIPFVIPGQERENAEFLERNGFAYYVKHYKDINSIIDNLIKNPTLLTNMKNNLKVIASTYSTNAIIKISDDLIDSQR